MRPSRRSLLLTLAILGAVGYLALVGFFTLWNLHLPAPSTEEKLLEALRRQPGAEILAPPESFRINPIRGARAEGLKIAQQLPRARIELQIDRLSLRPRLLDSIRQGSLRLGTLRLVRPVIVLQASPPRDAPPVAASSRSGRDRGKSSERPRSRRSGPPVPAPAIDLEMRNGTILLLAQADGRPLVSLEGVDMDLRVARLQAGGAPFPEGIAASGEVSIDRLKTELWEVAGAEGAFDLDEGVVVLSDLEARGADIGSYRLDLQLALTARPVDYKLALEAESVDPGALLSGSPRSGFGAAALTLRAAGTGLQGKDIQGQGRFLLQPGRLGPVPFLRRLEGELRGSRPIVGASYDRLEVPFTLDKGWIVLDQPVSIRTEPFDLSLGGRLAMDGELRLRASLDTAREGLEVEGVQAGLLDFAADDDGRIRLSFEVTGTREEPRLSLAASDLEEYRRRLKDPDKRKQLIDGLLDELLERAERD